MSWLTDYKARRLSERDKIQLHVARVVIKYNCTHHVKVAGGQTRPTLNMLKQEGLKHGKDFVHASNRDFYFTSPEVATLIKLRYA